MQRQPSLDIYSVDWTNFIGQLNFLRTISQPDDRQLSRVSRESVAILSDVHHLGASFESGESDDGDVTIGPSGPLDQ